MSNQILSKVSFVSKMSVLMKATSDDDKPIPGYIYNEICKITSESAENCENLVDFLVDRLQRDSTHVKIKVLKLMKYLVENGHPNFKLGLLKKSTAIQEATKHSGPPDPLHGNVPYVMVRKTAERVSEMLFNMDIAGTLPDTASAVREQHKHPMIGIGPISSTERGNTSKMEGFGNTAAAQTNRSLGENIKEGIFSLVERLGETTSDQQRELLSTLDCNSGYTPPTGNLTHDIHACTISQASSDPHIVTQASPPKHIPGKAGGGWDDSDDDDDDVTDDAMDDFNSRKQITKSDGSSNAELLERLDMQVDLTVEQTLVSGYIENTDNHSSMLLKRVELKSFLKECSSLNCDQVVEILNAQLLSSVDQAVMRSLMLIEALMNSDLVNLERLTRVCKDGMVSVVTDRGGQLKSKSRKLIRILEKLTSHHNILKISSQMVDINT